MISLQASGNCNFMYVTSLRTYPHQDMEKALRDLFTGPKNAFSKKATFRDHSCAFIIFAQGSEDSIKTNPYAPKFKEVIEKYELGEVWRSKPGPNILHCGKPGTLFVWRLDHKAIHKWWQGLKHD